MNILSMLFQLPVRLLALIFSASSLLFTPSAIAQNDEIPAGIQADEIQWFTPPAGFAQGAEGAMLAGPPNKEGSLYTIRVRLEKGGIINPHRHPDKRQITILRGTLYAGRGSKIAEPYTTQYTPGSFFVVPADYVHFSWAKDGDVVYQETGIGPTANELVESE